MKQKDFHIGIKAVIKNGGKILLLNEVSRFNGYDFPGGKIDKGEGWQEALKRELLEELGLKRFRVEEILGIYERPDYNENGTNLMLVFYKVSAKISKIKLSKEHSNFKWVTKKDYKDIKFRNEGVKTILAKAFNI